MEATHCESRKFPTGSRVSYHVEEALPRLLAALCCLRYRPSLLIALQESTLRSIERCWLSPEKLGEERRTLSESPNVPVNSLAVPGGVADCVLAGDSGATSAAPS